MLVAATTVGTFTGSAERLTPSVEKTANFDTRKQVELSLATSSFRAPAKAESTADYPTSLEGKEALVNFTLVESDGTYDLANTVTFSNEEEENGVIYYTMSSFLSGIFIDAVGTPDVEVAYFPEYGELYLIANQVYATYTDATTGTVDEFALWTNTEDTYWRRLNLCFKYDNGVFNLVNPIEVWFEDEDEPSYFTASYVGFGTVTDDGYLSLLCRFNPDLTITPMDGTGEMTWVMESSAYGIIDLATTVGVTVNSDVVTIFNFGEVENVPMTIDTNAKTLTATNVQISSITKYKAYLSEQAADGSNAAGSRVYSLQSTYEVSGGQTVISVPDWNAFYYEFGSGETYYYYPMTNTQIVLNFDLDELAAAGVNTVAADATFDVNAPVEYFNLQGIRVANPEAGQLLIKRQGNKATKVVIR